MFGLQDFNQLRETRKYIYPFLPFKGIENIGAIFSQKKERQLGNFGKQIKPNLYVNAFPKDFPLLLFIIIGIFAFSSFIYLFFAIAFITKMDRTIHVMNFWPSFKEDKILLYSSRCDWGLNQSTTDENEMSRIIILHTNEARRDFITVITELKKYST